MLNKQLTYARPSIWKLGIKNNIFSRNITMRSNSTLVRMGWCTRIPQLKTEKTFVVNTQQLA